MTRLLAGLGLLLGLCVSITVLALPPDSALDGVGDRFRSFSLHLTDADTLWWLTPVISVLVGTAIGIAAAKLGRRLVRTDPVS